MTDLLNNIKFTSKPIAVISSDWHMALNAWKKHPGIKGDAEFSLSQTVDIATHLGVPIIGAGDLFDVKTPDSYSVSAVARQMARMHEKGLPVYYVQGQHEMSDPAWMSLFPGCHNAHDKNFTIGSISFFGYDYFLPKSVEDSYNRFKPADILITHQVWSELLPRHGQSFCCSYSLISQNNTYKAIVSGDYHSHFKDTIYNTGCLFVSPGSSCLQDMNESPNKAIWVLTESMEFISVPIKARRLTNVVIQSDNDLFVSVSLADSLVEDAFPNGIGKPIVRVKYNTEIKNVYAAMNNAYKDKAYLDFKPIMEDDITDEPIEHHPIKLITSSADEIFCESLEECLPSNHRGLSDIVRIWRTSNLDELRKEISTIADEIKNIDKTEQLGAK
jgi:hypothetical protein